MPRLEIRNIAVKRGRAEVLTDVSLSVPAGEVVALLGNNGAGKSTTLRAVSGLHHPTSGEILLDGEKITRLRTREIVSLGIAHVPEGRLVFPELTVQENLEVAALFRGGIDRQDLHRVLEIFPVLGQRLGQRAGSLSGGQQQMLAIGRGLIARPRLLLLDEPSLGLAPKVVHAIAEVLSRLREEGLSILLVEQNANLALRVATHGYVLANGRITVSGDASSLVANDEVRRSYLGV